MRAFFTVLAAFAGLLATDHSLHAIPIYRYAWVPTDPAIQGNAAPAPLGAPGSGYIDFLAPTDGGASAGSGAIFDLQFTGFAANGGGLLPDIQTFTYDSSHAISPLGGEILWNSQKITYMRGITLFNPSAVGMSSQISDRQVQTVFPLAYHFNETSRTGEWQFQGVLDRQRVSETSGNALILMVSGAALALFHLAIRRHKGLLEPL